MAAPRLVSANILLNHEFPWPAEFSTVDVESAAAKGRFLFISRTEGEETKETAYKVKAAEHAERTEKARSFQIRARVPLWSSTTNNKSKKKSP
ncbi:unnamed protein product [Boreogadus saida]